MGDGFLVEFSRLVDAGNSPEFAAVRVLLEPGAMAMLAAGVVCVVGMFIVTMVFNVPHNDALTAFDPASSRRRGCMAALPERLDALAEPRANDRIHCGLHPFSSPPSRSDKACWRSALGRSGVKRGAPQHKTYCVGRLLNVDLVRRTGRRLTSMSVDE
jgi:hypothetical protein